ncbi:hypothetical protein SH528x_007293 [Novipirellula sp. SH528]|uniref:hypothetical protein n=1 Tax=Novipirellula sp. SH528 TaxID=3454466 RepID=UPI003F9FFC77
MKAVNYYDELMLQLKVVKDRVRGVIKGTCNGLYLHGSPGTSKTHTVCSTLDELAVKYTYSSGHLTPIGLFQLLADNHDRVIVLDDVSSVFNQPIALQLLLAALGNRHDSSGVRRVRHTTAKSDSVVEFSGGIICISNLALKSHGNEVIKALGDRVYIINYEPTEDQIIAMIEHIASEGIDGVAPSDARNVATFLIKECNRRNTRPTVRMFVDKAIKDFELFTMGGSELHWHDLIISNLEQQLVVLSQPTTDLSTAEKKEAEKRIALDIYVTIDAPTERVSAWKERTGKSQPSFYRRVDQLKKEGRLS